MTYHERYFKHVEDCHCDIEKIKTTMNSAVKRVSPWEVDAQGNRLFYVDSFGYRGQIPGESEVCYQAMSKAREEASKIPEGCTCCYSSNGVLDLLEYDCPHHGDEAIKMYGPQ